MYCPVSRTESQNKFCCSGSFPGGLCLACIESKVIQQTGILIIGSGEMTHF